MTNQMTILVMCIAFTIAAVNSGQSEELSPVRGFAGYEYESGLRSIEKDMEESGYTLIDRTDSALWYSSTFLDIDCELGYIFKSNRLIGGSFILKSATERDFAKVSNHLNQIYGTTSNIEIKEDGIVVATIDAPDSTITQTLDLDYELHEVTYTREE